MHSVFDFIIYFFIKKLHPLKMLGVKGYLRETSISDYFIKVNITFTSSVFSFLQTVSISIIAASKFS